ncbi:endo-1,4-beta-xylanase [Hamadaea tsunoensis]|uniref:endo-1,4-beta-xylanase n=1 Tax=Hamadaea tsunoensis TaxID=53368 RepID=UPI000408BA31|nr:endo-1,4-beta-xylanase [Hamadaea tsunoensis]
MSAYSRTPRPALWRAVIIGSAAAAAALLVATMSTGPTPARAADPTLHQLMVNKGRVYFGSATDNGELSDTPYTTILGSEFGSITPGNSMKWDTIEPTQNTFNFTKGDAIVTFAQAHNQIVRGHTLVWHNQLPGWVSSLPAASVQAAMENHITQEATHYKGKVYSWDVVNEPFNDDGTYRTSPFYNAMGTAYIADAFRTARAADPTAKLYINDYNIDGTGAKADAMYSLVSSLKSQGVPIDGVGFQGHLAVQYGFPTNMQANLQRFAALGLDVAITELDVRMVLPADSSKVATQNQYYTNVVNACIGVTRCVGITIWDYTDKYSWVPGTFSGQGSALPWDENLLKKPAYSAIAAALGLTSPSPSASASSSASPSPSASRSASPSPSVSPSASPSTSPNPGGGCKVVYAASPWTESAGVGGFTANITITNTGSTPISGWSLKFSLPSGQTLTQSGWSATYAVSGQAVTATNVSYNSAIAAGASIGIGFNGRWTGSYTSPTSFTLNNVACS